MDIFHIILGLATLLCALVAGFLLAFAIVVMPGIGRLDDRSFIRAFQEIDGIIQNNQPLFIVVWLGSVVLLVLSAVIALWQLGGLALQITISAMLIYVLGVQLPTILVNIPLNNQLQALDLQAADPQAARQAFEARWNRWNRLRTALAALAAAMLIITLINL